jgi:hypothetical protein
LGKNVFLKSDILKTDPAEILTTEDEVLDNFGDLFFLPKNQLGINSCGDRL